MTRRRPRALVLALALLAAPLAAPAGGAEALPLYGGDVRALVFDPRHSERAFAGTAAGQLYRSDDGGASWREAGGLVAFPGWVVATLVFDPHRDGRLWAGLRGVWGGGGVALSDDLGESWSWRAGDGLEAEAVQTLLPVAGAPDRLLAGTRGGVWRSDDAGRSWRKLTGGVPGIEQVASLAADAGAPERLLAGTWRRAFRSLDGGASWSGVFEGMVLDTEVFRLVRAGDADDRLWAATCGWLYRTDDFGAQWTRVTAGIAERRTRGLVALTDRRLVVGTVGGIFLSDDGGESFRHAAAPALSIVALAHHPARPERVLAASDGAGVWRSLDGGESFVPASRGLAALRVSAVVASGGSLYAAVPWAGPASGIYRARADGGDFERLGGELSAPSGLAVADGRLVASTDEALLAWDGRSWRRLAGGDGTRVGRLRDRPEGFVVTIDDRELAWRDGRLAPAPADAHSGEVAPPAASAELPAGAIVAIASWNGRRIAATAGLGLRVLSAPGPSPVALEALEDPQVGREASLGDR